MAESITLARPYAKAAFAHAKAANNLKEWSTMLKLATYIAQDSDVKAFVKNPKATDEQIASLFLDLGEKQFADDFSNFIQLLVANNRITLLPEIAVLYEQHRADAERTVDVNVVSAFAMQQEEQENLKVALKKRLGRDVILHCSVDPTLIAGVIIRAGDKVIDGSARGRLVQLAESLVS